MADEDKQDPTETQAHAAAADPAKDATKAPADAKRDDDDDGPDVEGHKAYATSDIRLKTDIRPLVR